MDVKPPDAAGAVEAPAAVVGLPVAAALAAGATLAGAADAGAAEAGALLAAAGLVAVGAAEPNGFACPAVAVGTVPPDAGVLVAVPPPQAASRTAAAPPTIPPRSDRREMRMCSDTIAPFTVGPLYPYLPDLFDRLYDRCRGNPARLVGHQPSAP